LAGRQDGRVHRFSIAPSLHSHRIHVPDDRASRLVSQKLCGDRISEYSFTMGHRER
jgi:hypothetical protein